MKITGTNLLIINRYSSYINLKFINLYNKLRILILVLPLYLTYYL